MTDDEAWSILAHRGRRAWAEEDRDQPTRLWWLLLALICAGWAVSLAGCTPTREVREAAEQIEADARALGGAVARYRAGAERLAAGAPPEGRAALARAGEAVERAVAALGSSAAAAARVAR